MSSILTARHLSKTFKTPVRRRTGFWGAVESFFKREYSLVQAVQDVDIEIKEGELVGFLGPNGAGKTTTLKMISGLLYPDAGSIDVLGFQPQERRPEFLRRITLVMGNRSQLWWEIAIEESLLLNKEIYELSDVFYRESRDELVDLLEIGDLMAIPAKKLSLGQRMKAEFAAALLHRPKVLLLDEPTLGLDIVMQKKIRQFLLDYNRRYQATILLTSHNMDDVAELCERVIIINLGHLIYDGGLKTLVERYAPFKKLKVEFAEAAEPEMLKTFKLSIQNSSYLVAHTQVPRAHVPFVASRILKASGQELPSIIDLTIEESPVEDVIQTIFLEQKKAV